MSEDGRRAGEAGTTLVELLVAIALLALLCSYAFGAIHHLHSFDRMLHTFEHANSVEAVAAHMRRTIAGSRVAFLTRPGTQAQLAFAGEEDRIALVTDGDSRLELGGLHLVQIGLKENEGGGRKMVAFRRVFRPSMPAEPGEIEPIILSDDIESLQFRYFGAPDGMDPIWNATWQSIKTLPLAVKVEVAFTDGRRWPTMIVAIPAAR
jgi:type II secretory pathway pseudopilin PulG